MAIKDKVMDAQRIVLNEVRKKLQITEAKLRIAESQIKVADSVIDRYDLKDRPKWDKQKRFGWWDKRKLKKKPELSYIITMLFPNCTSKDFVIVGERKLFTYKKHKFIIDTREAWYDITQNQYHLYYSFDEAVPISNEIKPLPPLVIPVTQKGKEVFLHVKSDNAGEVIEQEYIKILASSSLNTFLKVNVILTAFLLLMMFANTIMTWMNSSNISHIVKVISK